MIRRPPRSTRTYTLLPYTTLFRSAIRDYYANRKQAGSADPGSYRPVEPAQLYLNAEEWAARIGSHAAHLTTPFHEPEIEQVVDFGVDNARDFAPERVHNAKVYAAAGKHIASLPRSDKQVIHASYSVGARASFTTYERRV